MTGKTETISEKVMATIGVFVALIYDGKVMLMRRMRDDSIIPGKSFFGNWELPGGAVEHSHIGNGYGGLVNAALQKVAEKTGFNLVGLGYDLSPTYQMQALLAKLPNGSIDLANVLSITAYEGLFNALQGDNFIWVDVEELNDMANDFALPDKETGISGTGIVSGWGKRMHVMALCGLTSAIHNAGAHRTLAEIRADW